ncbi:MAG: ATP-binding protein [Euryarchaeota archaeon]|nr:ATP-binding protein [Euryarchaeota archaeon]MCG2727168.1 ATP-binding protein [Candidatus Methanoperedenaceae archaeon]
MVANLDEIIEKLIGKPESYTLQRDTLDTYLERHKMYLNPFADKIVDDKMFINKDETVCNRIMRAARHNQSSLMILIGPTGSGKSENADFIVRNLPPDFIFWYNQVYGQNSVQLATSIIGDLDPNYLTKLSAADREMILDIYNDVLKALVRNNKKLFCIFDQGEHFSKDAFELVTNSTNPYFAANRAFTGLILAVPRFEKQIEEWTEDLDTMLRRALIREYTLPFTVPQRLEYIFRALMSGKKKSYLELMKKRDFDPFNEEAILYLMEKSEGHPSTLNNLCYISLELASAISPDAIITESVVEEAWNKFPNKGIHQEAIKWYKEKSLYYKQD